MTDLIGGAEEDRTPDLCSAIAALSHLSYGPKAGPFMNWARGLSSKPCQKPGRARAVPGLPGGLPAGRQLAAGAGGRGCERAETGVAYNTKRALDASRTPPGRPL